MVTRVLEDKVIPLMLNFIGRTCNCWDAYRRQKWRCRLKTVKPFAPILYCKYSLSDLWEDAIELQEITYLQGLASSCVSPKWYSCEGQEDIYIFWLTRNWLRIKLTFNYSEQVVAWEIGGRFRREKENRWRYEVLVLIAWDRLICQDQTNTIQLFPTKSFLLVPHGYNFGLVVR